MQNVRKSKVDILQNRFYLKLNLIKRIFIFIKQKKTSLKNEQKRDGVFKVFPLRLNHRNAFSMREKM
jgi:hypothetical protein